MNDTYYIAWSPTSGYVPYTFTLDANATRRIAKCNIGKSETIEIRAVRIIEEEKVREMYGALKTISHIHIETLESVLPEPKATGETHE